MAVELRAGVVIADKLRLLRPLGQGGMGVVWAARHLALETDVAVKLIRPERAATDPGLLARFEREAKTTARIAHPHVVKVMDYGAIDDAVPYIVMELLSGFSLADLLERGGRLSLATARVLLEQVGGALASAHERGIVHRDIKPHNVFILEQTQGQPLFVKVLDFGVAKMLGDAQVPGGSLTLTQTGTVIGSPPYMSPEQIEGSKHVDFRADLWSLAVIVYESLTGELPFVGSSFVAVGAAVLRGKYRPASQLRKGLPRSIDDWFAKALSVDRDGRFQSAREMVAAFAEHDLEQHSVRSEQPAVHAAEIRTLTHASAARAPLKRARGVTSRRAAFAIVLGGLAIAAAIADTAPASLRASSGCPSGMKRIEGGRFRMGSAPEGDTPSDETPQHAVTLKPFCLDVTEVTVGAYSDCKSCEPLSHNVQVEGLTFNAIAFYSRFCNGRDKPDHPVNCIDVHAAEAYCESIGKRLPTEAEWELAARSERSATYPWGEAAPAGQLLNACGAECSRMLTEELEKMGQAPWPAMYRDDDGAPATAAVGKHAAGATPSGIMDLAGNVWEWTSSPWCRYDKGDCGESRRVIRGGGWDTVESQAVRAANRRGSPPSARSWSIGFRCAKSQ